MHRQPYTRPAPYVLLETYNMLGTEGNSVKPSNASMTLLENGPVLTYMVLALVLNVLEEGETWMSRNNKGRIFEEGRWRLGL